MCGIIGYVGKREASSILIDGLKRLEYRGYDSAGIAVISKNSVNILKSPGKLINLERHLKENYVDGNTGIGHTRWATHGKPSERNAHPHRARGIVVVHNGIIENYIELKKRLRKEGHKFSSDTDSEVIPHLIYRFIKKGYRFEDSVPMALRELKGSYAIGVIYEGMPDTVIGARFGSPLIVGIGNDENFIASDIPAILPYTNKIISLNDGEIAIIRKNKIKFIDLNDRSIDKNYRVIDWNPLMAEKGGYKHFMLKEIFEQPRAISDTIMGRISQEKGRIFLNDINLNRKEIKRLKRVFIIGCGTSWHAGLLGKFFIESFGDIPVEVDIGSEFRYRDPIINKDTLVIAISQSGETADTIAAVKEAKEKGAKIISICNVVESSLVRESDGVIYTHAGPEIGVASTKAFTTQIVSLYLLSMYIGYKREAIQEDSLKTIIEELIKIPGQVEEVLMANEYIEEVAKKYFTKRDFLYIARGVNYPIALEGALKLKEISYIHAEAYPAGELKHGPIALIDENMPVFALLTQNHVYEKIMNNIEEVKTRGGRIIAVSEKGNKDAKKIADDILYIPQNNPFLTTILLTIPLQLFAYYIAVLKGTDVDQPRNLAKSVTVE
jgi:glucosamine--fructose-6-phosphate aminotransferase (isomerizing)